MWRFSSDASNLVSGDTNGMEDIFVHEVDFSLPPLLRATLPCHEQGFASNVVTLLPSQPAELAYQMTGNLWLEIPSQKVKANIVGVPQSENVWDVEWLRRLGWFNGTAFPYWKGNSVITAHVMGADGLPGPFAKLQGFALWRSGYCPFVGSAIHIRSTQQKAGSS